jgi:uncharacterized protein (TIGR03435 family)
LFALVVRSCVLLAAVTCLRSSSPAGLAQSPKPESGASAHSTPQEIKNLAFDVVSIRPAHGDGWLTRFTEDGFQGNSVPVQYFLRVAFSSTVAPPDILGMPKWAGETYDIEAKVAPEDAPAYKSLTREQREVMLQKVLVDRFQLRFHFGSTSHSIYNLTAVGADPKLMKFQVADYTSEGDNEPLMPLDGMLHFRAHPDSMTHLARRLSFQEDVEHKMVADRTDLPGYFNFDLSWCPLQDRPLPEALTCNGASLFTALKEQLGLQLKPAEASFKTVIIDQIEKPSPN